MDDNDEDIFLLDRYVHRPPQLEEMSYAEFGANYAVVYCDENLDDSLPAVMNDADAVSLRKIKLTNNFGKMHKRNCEAIIRFHKPNKEMNPQDFSRTKVMLYLPYQIYSEDIQITTRTIKVVKTFC